LRDRREDLPLLIRHFLEEFSVRYNRGKLQITKRAEYVLYRHPWPGNIRELENAISYACMMTQNGTVDIADLPDYLLESRADNGPSLPTLAEVERQYVMTVLKACDGNRARAAEILGIGRATLYRRFIAREGSTEDSGWEAAG
jgi:DNA-binding NtrC family response regulator